MVIFQKGKLRVFFFPTRARPLRVHIVPSTAGIPSAPCVSNIIDVVHQQISNTQHTRSRVRFMLRANPDGLTKYPLISTSGTNCNTIRIRQYVFVQRSNERMGRERTQIQSVS